MAGFKRCAHALLAAALMNAPAQAAPPIETYGRAPAVSHVEISPDGARLALGRGSEADWRVEVRNTADQRVVFRGSLGRAVLRGLFWAGPNHLLVITTLVVGPHPLNDSGGAEVLVGDLDLQKKTLLPLVFNGGEVRLPTIPMGMTVKGRPYLYYRQSNRAEGEFGAPSIYRLDFESRQAARLIDGHTDTSQFMLDLNGDPVARADYDLRSGAWTLVLKIRGDWKAAHSETALLDAPTLVGTALDGQSVFVRVHDAKGWVLHQASLQDASWSGPLESTRDMALPAGQVGRIGPGFYQDDVVYDPTTHAVAGVAGNEMERRRYSFFAPDDQKAWEVIARAFPAQDVEFQSWSDDHRTWVVKVDGKATPAFYLASPFKGTGDWIADETADLPDAAVAEERPITYTAADGLVVPAYLTVPKDRPARGLPLIVLVHGGPDATPEGRDDPGFHWQVQALAAQGYAVLAPQFRGSAGFGEAFKVAGFGQWGRKQQTDLSDGVRALAAQGVVDPGRVCIMGTGYGGYAALAGVTLQSGVYRCAVALDAITDLKRYRTYVSDQAGHYYDLALQREYDRAIGPSDGVVPVQEQISPALHADRASAPILLIHSENDEAVPFTQSQEMAAALSHAGKPVTLLILKDEDESLARTGTRTQMLTTTVKFLQANNPTDPAPARP